MTAIVFKGKVFDVYNRDDTFSHKEIALPKTFTSRHIEGAHSHRMFSGKVSPAIVDARVKKILADMKIWSIRLDKLHANVTVTGEFMATVRIEL